MNPKDTAYAYTLVAESWTALVAGSRYGVAHLERAMSLVSGSERRCLDVGCGGGRLAAHMVEAGFDVTGLDASPGMLAVASRTVPGARFICADVSEWRSDARFELIVAWDSTFHLPKALQVPVLRKLCRHLAPAGVLLFTAGGVDGERSSGFDGQVFYYASVEAHVLAETLFQESCRIVLLERDQHPEDHVVVIAVRVGA